MNKYNSKYENERDRIAGKINSTFYQNSYEVKS